ncbi:pre-mRNA-processing factor 39 [Clohesyomyces aquaticus]|uniref:Pre-mRNA-processing factor 39 n=1 Tax=Clohesyomyces aquaticus TaxID=1231657 RepID=A0A1Y1YDL0_9PLEO|nr:pre-mRNA-processing factor 39 [Clohesyomyces aquaticus]
MARGMIAGLRYDNEDENTADVRKLINAVAEDEDNFEKWEALVTFCESLEGGVNRNSSPDAIAVMRGAFDCFLDKYPLFFGYWKKYADLEFSIGGTETAEMVYERGVSCVPTSVDLWTAYCSFKENTCHDVDLVRELFERGAHFVGLDFQCHPFWDKYIEFEKRIEHPENVTKILERIVHVPMYQFSRNFEKFRQEISVRPIEELGDAGLLQQMKDLVVVETQGELARSELEMDRLLRAKLDQYYMEAYNRTHIETMKRWTFEQNIKRAYFHVTELDEAELVNWRKYLDFEETEGNFHRITFLYERCLVVCALYDEFWLRYARWMLAQGKEEDTRIIYVRASTIFVPIARPAVRLQWARFEEMKGRMDVAIDIHLAILDQCPEHIETIISLAGLKRRQDGPDAAIELLNQYKDERDSYIGAHLTAEQARILYKCKGSALEARQLFQAFEDMYLDSRAFWIKYLQFEMEQMHFPGSEEDIHGRVRNVHNAIRTKGRFSPSTMKDLSHYYMEYLLDCGSKKAATEYMAIDKEVNG